MSRATSWLLVAVAALVGLTVVLVLDAAEGPPARGPGPGGFPGGPPRGMRPGRSAAPAAPVENPPLAKTDREKKILEVLDDMDRNQRRGMMNVSKEDGRLLRLLAEAVGAKHVVEIGTSNGFSGTWFCLGLLNTGGKLTTHEIDAGRASLARKNFERAGVADIVTLVEGDAHKEVSKLKGPIDVVFLDADKEGYIDYLNKLLPLLRPGGLILAHNVRSQGSSMKPFLDAITTNKDLETNFLLMNGAGVSATLKKR
ncbi:MAG TPA: class I SAM-dependent methyltransferase [Phycisphaerae bacterium]|nr:class I SAM-dependent methyltransferase [Phycisphaerae bacterium]